MKTLMLWYLISYGYGISYSPAMPSLAACEQAKAQVSGRSSYNYQCISIETVVNKDTTK